MIKVTNLNETGTTSTIDLNALTAKTTPVDADLTLLGDSADSFANKKSTYTNVKAFLKTYFDTLYQTVSTALLKANNLSDLASVATAKTNLSLNNVDNTTDLNKPISTATQTALDLKVTEITGTDNAIVRSDGTGGNIQNSGVLVDDNNNIVLPTTTQAVTNGFIYKNTVRFMHNYYGNYVGMNGNNLFVGLNAGNFTLNAVAAVYEGSFNVAVGDSTLTSITTGYNNVALGYKALTLNTTGSNNFGLGAFSLEKVTTNGGNTAVGTESAEYTTGSSNTIVGKRAGQGVNGSSTYSNNTAIGFQSLQACTTGGNNITIGYLAGDVITTGGSNIIIGISLDPTANNVSNQLNIGGVLYGSGMYGTGSIGIGVIPTNITARLHLPAGTTSASSAPLKLTSGSLNTTAEAGAVEFLTDQIYFTQTQNALRKEIALREATRVSGQFDKVNNTTLANVTGLTATLGAGKTYTFKAVLFVDADVTGGQKYSIGGTATATSIIFQINSVDNGTNVNTINSRQTALGGSAGQAGTTTAYTEITGTITCNATGTLTVQFAQNSASGTSSVLVGSSFIVENIL